MGKQIKAIREDCIWSTEELTVYDGEQVELVDYWTENFITVPEDELTAFCLHWLNLVVEKARQPDWGKKEE
jgi:hypothetical protein